MATPLKQLASVITIGDLHKIGLINIPSQGKKGAQNTSHLLRREREQCLLLAGRGSQVPPNAPPPHTPYNMVNGCWAERLEWVNASKLTMHLWVTPHSWSCRNPSYMH